MVAAPALCLNTKPAGFGHALRGFPFRACLDRFDSIRSVLSCGSACYRVLPHSALPDPLKTGASFGLSCPTAPSKSPATTPRFHPRVSTTSTVSHRHRGHSSGKSLPGLFHPGSAPGLSLQGVLLKCWVGHFRNQLPLVPFPVATDLSGCPRHPTRGLGRLQGIAKHLTSFTSPERVSTTGAADPLLGFFLLRVFPAEENGKLSPPPLMRVCRLNSRRSPPGTRYRVYFFLSGQRLSRGVIPLSRFPATKCLLTFYGEKPPVWRWLVV